MAFNSFLTFIIVFKDARIKNKASSYKQNYQRFMSLTKNS